MAGNMDRECPNCKSPIAQGLKFCESCGTKIEPVQLCPDCGSTLAPGLKFCESCGKPVGNPPKPVEQTPVQQSAAATSKPVPETEPSPANPKATPQTPPPAPVVEALKTTPRKEVPSQGSPNKILIIAGIVGIIIIAALGYFVVLPMLGSSGTGGGGLSLPGGAPATAAIPSASGTQNLPAVSFEPKPTDRVPTNLQVTFQAERNNINGLVTVTFAGGPGMNGISQSELILTKSDGTIEKKTFRPKQTGDAVTLQGTLRTDRLEVIAHYYSGESFRVLDQLFEYKKKN